MLANPRAARNHCSAESDPVTAGYRPKLSPKSNARGVHGRREENSTAAGRLLSPTAPSSPTTVVSAPEACAISRAAHFRSEPRLRGRLPDRRARPRQGDRPPRRRPGPVGPVRSRQRRSAKARAATGGPGGEDDDEDRWQPRRLRPPGRWAQEGWGGDNFGSSPGCAPVATAPSSGAGHTTFKPGASWLGS